MINVPFSESDSLYNLIKKELDTVHNPKFKELIGKKDSKYNTIRPLLQKLSNANNLSGLQDLQTALYAFRDHPTDVTHENLMAVMERIDVATDKIRVNSVITFLMSGHSKYDEHTTKIFIDMLKNPQFTSREQSHIASVMQMYLVHAQPATPDSLYAAGDIIGLIQASELGQALKDEYTRTINQTEDRSQHCALQKTIMEAPEDVKDLLDIFLHAEDHVDYMARNAAAQSIIGIHQEHQKSADYESRLREVITPLDSESFRQGLKKHLQEHNQRKASAAPAPNDDSDFHNLIHGPS